MPIARNTKTQTSQRRPYPVGAGLLRLTLTRRERHDFCGATSSIPHHSLALARLDIHTERPIQLQLEPIAAPKKSAHLPPLAKTAALHGHTHTTSSSPLLPVPTTPSTPCATNSSPCLSAARSSTSNLSPSISASLASFATRNLRVSRARMAAAWAAGSWDAAASAWVWRWVLWVRERRWAREVAWERRRARASARVEREAEMREREARSGAEWKFEVVEWISCWGTD